MVDLIVLSSTSGRAIATFSNFYVSHGSTASFLRGWAKNIISVLQIIHCCFQQWNNFHNRLTVDEVIAKSSTPRFYRAACNADAVLWWEFCPSVRLSVCLSVRPSHAWIV